MSGQEVTIAGVLVKNADGSTKTDILEKGELTSIFKPSSYDADLIMDGTGTAVALATGALKIKVTNRGATTEAVRVVFGTSSADAISNLTIGGGFATTGDYLPASADQGDGTAIYGIPSSATHYAVGRAVNSDTQTVSITQGV